MRKFIFAFIVALTVPGGSLVAQNIAIPSDSIQRLLCNKWEVDYAIMGGMKIGRMPGASEINYAFNKDKTFIMIGSSPKEMKKGTWRYDPKKKVIRLTVDGRSNTSIISLKEGEFVMLADTKNATPDDPMEIKLVYKLRTK